MGIERMELVNIIGSMDELDEALVRCCDSGCFHIEPAFKSEQNSTVKLLNEKNPYEQPMKAFSAMAAAMEVALEEADGSGYEKYHPDDFEKLAEDIENELSEYSRLKIDCASDVSDMEAAVVQINHLKGLNSDFEKIFSCKHTAVRVGRLPADNLAKLEYYDQIFFFVPFETTRDYCWGMYFCAENDKEIVDSIFKSMYFERIDIPEYVKGNADEAVKKLEEQISEKKKETARYNEEIIKLSKKHGETVKKVFTALRKKYDIFELRRKVGSVKGKFYIKGFIPYKEGERFDKLFEDLDSVLVDHLPPDADAYCTPPTKLKNNWLTRPFSMLVEMYGLPKYGGYNPTSFVALTYTVLFGIMFGDLGQGLLLFLGGFFVAKKFDKRAGGMVSRVGLSSMIFGTLYGSVFGFEELLDPVFENLGIDFLPLKVFKQTNFILITAVGIGIALIVISMLTNIIISFKEKDIEKAVFGCNGIAGLVFYGSVCAGVVGTMMFDVKIMSTPFVLCLIVIPLICIFCRVPFAAAVKYKQWRLSEDEEDMTVGGFIVENFFEMFEFLLSYVSNTMSFLRVGGFVLSHAGMMLVVMTLMEGASAVGKPIVLVIGNLFVMAMEGMIVAIQIIRLEFYEIFSRFYESDGKPFEPISVKFSADLDAE